jgi:hypothetical protein
VHRTLAVITRRAPVALQPAATRDLPKQTPATKTVYVTKTGEKYHIAGCRSLVKSSIPMAHSTTRGRLRCKQILAASSRWR